MRGHRGATVKARAQVEVGGHRHIGRHGLNIEGTEKPGINADVRELVLLGHDLAQRLAERLHRIARETAKDDHTPGLRRVGDQLAKRRHRHREAGERYELRRVAPACRRDVLAGALDDLIEIESTVAVHRQVGFRQLDEVSGGLGLDRHGFFAEGVATIADVVGERLGIALHGRRAALDGVEIQTVDGLSDCLNPADRGDQSEDDGEATHVSGSSQHATVALAPDEVAHVLALHGEGPASLRGHGRGT